MIRNSSEFKSEIRTNMRGGNGDIIISHILNTADDLKAPARLFAKLTVEKNCSIGIHEHINEEEVFYILKGTAGFNDNGTEKILHAGDAAVTSNASHAITNIGDDTLEILAVILKF
ncbi:MAG: cupin domain-containing protein [Lentisphaeria bacterium]|nr:cupin domain-containing protein [Lentisphaeria bacterium]